MRPIDKFVELSTLMGWLINLSLGSQDDPRLIILANNSQIFIPST